MFYVAFTYEKTNSGNKYRRDTVCDMTECHETYRVSFTTINYTLNNVSVRLVETKNFQFQSMKYALKLQCNEDI